MKLRLFVSWTIKKVKRKATDNEKKFIKNISHTGLISRIYKEFLQNEYTKKDNRKMSISDGPQINEKSVQHH